MKGLIVFLGLFLTACAVRITSDPVQVEPIQVVYTVDPVLLDDYFNEKCGGHPECVALGKQDFLITLNAVSGGGGTQQ
jgi:hypothetical protein